MKEENEFEGNVACEKCGSLIHFEIPESKRRIIAGGEVVKRQYEKCPKCGNEQHMETRTKSTNPHST